MKMKINEMEIDITRQDNFPEEHFERFIKIMEEYLKGKENIRTAKETKEVIERIIENKFPSEKTLQENIEYFEDDKEDVIDEDGINFGKTKGEEKIFDCAEHIASIVENCLINDGSFLMWWNKAGEFKNSETAKFSNKMVTLSEEDRAEYNFGW